MLALALAILLAAAPAGSAQEAPPPVDARPTVRISGLFNGNTIPLGQPTVLTAIAEDDKGIAQVRFLRDFTAFAVDTTPPYQAMYTPMTPDRAELLTAEATDTAGQVTEFSIAVQIPRAQEPREDRPPRIVLDTPAEKQLVPTAGTVLTARAQDDFGIAYVRFLAGAKTVCDDRVAPYACRYEPESADVGRIKTFTAIAVDGFGQSQGAIRDARIARFDPLAVTLLLRRTRREGRIARMTIQGRVKLPDAITVARGCNGGKVRVRARRGGRTVAIVSPILDDTCRYKTTLRVPAGGRVRLSASFQGNALVGTKNAATRLARAR